MWVVPIRLPDEHQSLSSSQYENSSISPAEPSPSHNFLEVLKHLMLTTSLFTSPVTVHTTKYSSCSSSGQFLLGSSSEALDSRVDTCGHADIIYPDEGLGYQ